jgi:hypothetical protein
LNDPLVCISLEGSAEGIQEELAVGIVVKAQPFQTSRSVHAALKADLDQLARFGLDAPAVD